MTLQPLVLDANTLHDRSFLHAISSYHGQKIVPAVAYTEAIVHILNQGGPLERFDAMLRQVGAEVEWFRQKHGQTAARTGALVGDFSENARDHLIAAHAVAPNRFLVTHNTADFTFLQDRVLTPAGARGRFAF